MREAKYATERDLLLKLAVSTNEKRKLFPGLPKCTKFKEGIKEIIFDLRENFELEFQPSTVAKHLRRALVAKKQDVACLPKFVSFTRVDSEVTLTIEQLPVSMTKFFSDEEELEAHSFKVVKCLVLAA